MSLSKLRPLLTSKISKGFVRTASVTSCPVDVTERTSCKSWKEIPGPSALPLIGQLHHFFPGGSLYERTDMWRELNQKYGDIVKLHTPFTPFIVAIYDAEGVAQVLRAENILPVRPGLDVFHYYRKQKYNQSTPGKPKLLGLTIDQGEGWKLARSVIGQIMLKPDVPNKYKNTIENVAQDAMIRLKHLLNENNTIPNFNNEVRLWGFETSSVVALGRRMNFLEPNRIFDERSNEVKLMRYTQDTIQLLYIFDSKPSFWKYYPTKNFRQAMFMFEEMERTTREYVKLSKKEFEMSNKPDEEKGILEKLLETNEELATINACDILLAGIDTLPTTLLGTLYCLAKNPQKQTKLREILDTSEGKNYLKACLKESMRMMPSVGRNIRLSTRDHDVMGYKIPKGTYVVLCHHHLSLSEDQYPRASEYIPERWLVSKDDPLYYGNANPFSYAPFGFGTRTCIGRRLAEAQMKAFLYNFIKNFSIDWQGPPPHIKMEHLNQFRENRFIVKDLAKERQLSKSI